MDYILKVFCFERDLYFIVQKSAYTLPAISQVVHIFGIVGHLFSTTGTACLCNDKTAWTIRE